MSRSIQPVELNTFVGGLITEASPLTFPLNASLDEENFVLSRKGSRARRLGMDLEDAYVSIDSGVVIPTTDDLHITSFKWQNVGGDATKTFIVVQIEYKLHFFDGSVQPLSSGLLSVWDYTNSDPVNNFSYASVDGMLVVVTGRKDVDTFIYTDGSLSKLSKRLKIRDQFGVTDIAAGV